MTSQPENIGDKMAAEFSFAYYIDGHEAEGVQNYLNTAVEGLSLIVKLSSLGLETSAHTDQALGMLEIIETKIAEAKHCIEVKAEKNG